MYFPDALFLCKRDTFHAILYKLTISWNITGTERHMLKPNHCIIRSICPSHGSTYDSSHNCYTLANIPRQSWTIDYSPIRDIHRIYMYTMIQSDSQCADVYSSIHYHPVYIKFFLLHMIPVMQIHRQGPRNPCASAITILASPEDGKGNPSKQPCQIPKPQWSTTLHGFCGRSTMHNQPILTHSSFLCCRWGLDKWSTDARCFKEMTISVWEVPLCPTSFSKWLLWDKNSHFERFPMVSMNVKPCEALDSRGKGSQRPTESHPRDKTLIELRDVRQSPNREWHGCKALL